MELADPRWAYVALANGLASILVLATQHLYGWAAAPVFGAAAMFVSALTRTDPEPGGSPRLRYVAITGAVLGTIGTILGVVLILLSFTVDA